MQEIILKILPCVLILCFFSCSHINEPEIEPYACTMEFVTIRLAVIDDKGLAADSVNIYVHNIRYHTIYDITDMNDPGNRMNQEGLYTVFHDGFRKQVKGRIERIIVVGEKGDFGFIAEFRVGIGVCHVYKISGPDTVTLKYKI